jgi:hypothetical protein
MFLSARWLHSYAIHTVDGKLGGIRKIFVDTSQWVARYLVVSVKFETLTRYALVSPISIDSNSCENKILSVALTLQEIWESPVIDIHKPLTRELEAAISTHYHLAAYWHGTGIWGDTDCPKTLRERRNPPSMKVLDPAPAPLVVFEELMKTVFLASENRHCHVTDLMIGENSWKVCYAVIEEGMSISETRYLFDPFCLKRPA